MFYVTDGDGRKITDEGELERVRAEIEHQLRLLSGPATVAGRRNDAQPGDHAHVTGGGRSRRQPSRDVAAGGGSR